jgi:hypothetical protein
MLQAESIEHVVLSAAAAPGVFEKSSHMTEVLREGALGATVSAFGFEPVQVILQLQVPQRNPGT